MPELNRCAKARDLAPRKAGACVTPPQSGIPSAHPPIAARPQTACVDSRLRSKRKVCECD